jgi:hypothetical protein
VNREQLLLDELKIELGTNSDVIMKPSPKPEEPQEDSASASETAATETHVKEWTSPINEFPHDNETPMCIEEALAVSPIPLRELDVAIEDMCYLNDTR